ncbi:hypothetical protein R4575_16980 [Acinetobacter baumannii]|nr:hypothetical protein [Acinetobacter baumannii]
MFDYPAIKNLVNNVLDSRKDFVKVDDCFFKSNEKGDTFKVYFKYTKLNISKNNHAPKFIYFSNADNFKDAQKEAKDLINFIESNTQ